MVDVPTAGQKIEEKWKEKWHWYQRRVRALENLLAYYRAGMPPSEKVLKELDLTRQYIDMNGAWKIG